MSDPQNQKDNRKSSKPKRFRPPTLGEKRAIIPVPQFKLDKEILKKLLPAKILEMIAAKTGAQDVRKRKLTCVVFFWLVILALGPGGPMNLIGMVSLCVTAGVMIGLPTSKAVKSKEAISENFRERPWQYFEAVLNYLLQAHGLLFIQKKGIECLQVVQRVRLVDSTVMRVSLKLVQKFPGARTGWRKVWAALKLHTAFDLFQGVPEVLAITAQKVNDRKVEFLLPTGEQVLYIFDLGYWKYWLFDQIMERKQHFITRLRTDCNPLIKKVYVGSQDWVGKRLKEITLTGTECDLLVNLSSSHPAEAKMKHDVRLVGQWLDKDQSWRLYITSLLAWQTFIVRLIVQLYRLRWQIEIFFRDLKSVLNIANFVSIGENGIRIQIYAALIYYVLTHILTLKAAEETNLSLELFSIPACLQVVGDVLKQHSALLVHSFEVDWSTLKYRLVEAIKAIMSRPNPKRIHRLTQVKQMQNPSGQLIPAPP